MRLRQILEYSTKRGQDIDLQYIPDSEGDNNRGWQVDQIDAYVDGEKVGFIKVSYIPHERWVKNYPSIFNYMAEINGKRYLFPFKKTDIHYERLTDEEQRNLLKRLKNDQRYGSDKDVEQLTNREVLQSLRDIEQKLLNGQQGVQFKQFKNFHKDKPLVDYIKVDEQWRRQGIGEALYQAAALWMKQKGMKLYASGLQSDEAKASWDKLKQKYNVTKAKRGRKYLEV